MSQLVISCGMLADELKKVCRKISYEQEIIWLKRGMHKSPEQLHESLQQLIYEHQDVDNILLTYGLCGNSTLGLYSPNTGLILPACHDCIHQLVGETQTGHYYLTRGWTLDREEPYQQIKQILVKYGEDFGKEIIQKYYGGYHTIDVIDTDSYPVEQVMQHAQKIGKLLNQKVEKIPGSTAILEKLLLGNWDDDFIVKMPGEKVTWR